jgi:hypothetical protein
MRGGAGGRVSDTPLTNPKMNETNIKIRMSENWPSMAPSAFVAHLNTSAQLYRSAIPL